jgi:hypothetical protein
MSRLLNGTFFHFLLGFVAILMVSFGLTFVINYYDDDIEQTAAAGNTQVQISER